MCSLSSICLVICEFSIFLTDYCVSITETRCANSVFRYWISVLLAYHLQYFFSLNTLPSGYTEQIRDECIYTAAIEKKKEIRKHKVNRLEIGSEQPFQMTSEH